jgi:hypothetical protein
LTIGFIFLIFIINKPNNMKINEKREKCKVESL